MSGVQRKLRSRFNSFCEALFGKLEPGEILSLGLNGEISDYVRWNQSKIRQWTKVDQFKVSFELQKDSRAVSGNRNFSFDETSLEIDLQNAFEFLAKLRAALRVMTSDPFLVPIHSTEKSEVFFEEPGMSASVMVEDIFNTAQAADLAGLFCSGDQVRAVKNSLGQDHWFSSTSFFFDYSLYNKDRASKGGYSGRKWVSEEWKNGFSETAKNLELSLSERTALESGKYKVYLAPQAVAEICGILGWGGFGASSFMQKTSPLLKLHQGELNLNPKFSVRENFGLGLSPRFNSLGEVSEEVISLISEGKSVQRLTSSKSAKEYGLKSNNASESEFPRSLEILPGSLAKENILKELGEGIYISQLHYLNWSDPMSARVTGMTRYVCLRVKDGQFVGPIQDLRFDQSLYEAFGENLLAITDFQETISEIGTYFERGIGGMRVPGLLVKDWNFVL